MKQKIPALSGDTLILTGKGYKQISEVKSNDLVLNADNAYSKVQSVTASTVSNIYHIKSMMTSHMDCSEGKEFLVRRKYYDYKNVRQFTNPKWTPVEKIDTDCFLGYAVNTESVIPEWNGCDGENVISNMIDKPFFWYLMGRYIGDGWKHIQYGKYMMVICCGGRHQAELEDAIKQTGVRCLTYKTPTTTNFNLCSKEFVMFAERYGYYSYGKFIDHDTMALPVNLLAKFIEGYRDSDGCLFGNNYNVISVSRKLIYGLAQCVSKVEHCHVRIAFTKRPEKYVIKGHEVNQRDTWTAIWHGEHRKHDRAFYEDGTVWFPVTKIEKVNKNVRMFNIHADGTFTANGSIVR